MKIAIIRDAGSTQATRIFQGVFGTLERPVDQATGETGPAATFRVDPELLAVSHLFGHLDAAGVAILASGVDVAEVPDDLGEVFKANLMQAMAARWETMYSDLQGNTQLDHLTSHMLRSESRQVLQGATGMLQRAQMHPYSVKARIAAQTGSAYSESQGEGVTTHSLINVLSSSIRDEAPGEFSIDAVEELDGQWLARDFAKQRFEERKASAEFQNSMMVQAPSFDGSNIEVKADLIMEFSAVGRNDAQAARIVQYILNENSMRGLGISRTLTATPIALENVRAERIAQGEIPAVQAPQIEQARQGGNDPEEGGGGEEPPRPRLIY